MVALTPLAITTLLRADNFIKKETLAQAFSCEVYKISKNNFFTGHLRATASGRTKHLHKS